ncbi:hypothetical protein RZS28_08525 [Methylocapsa polymorpha]|uniref:Uncharacterized protein n=1 Tax=Methylocapsa polymorpha TaxID=3080828 RepID=A0ABZ0HXJ8_9HYPH|nr:hypothetical protein RZS28_08525 [Methylocapsa sp. RX1]
MDLILKSSSDTIIKANSDKITLYYNQCRAASQRLSDDLLSHGHVAQVLRCSGLKTDAPDADKRWRETGAQEFWIHYVVQFDGQIVDLTRRQFFPACDNPFYQSSDAFAAEWTSFGPELQNPRHHAANIR